MHFLFPTRYICSASRPHPHSFPHLYSWLTGGTTIGSGLIYLTGEGTGKLLLKKLKLKKGETAAAGTTATSYKKDEENK